MVFSITILHNRTTQGQVADRVLVQRNLELWLSDVLIMYNVHYISSDMRRESLKIPKAFATCVHTDSGTLDVRASIVRSPHWWSNWEAHAARRDRERYKRDVGGFAQVCDTRALVVVGVFLDQDTEERMKWDLGGGARPHVLLFPLPLHLPPELDAMLSTPWIFEIVDTQLRVASPIVAPIAPRIRCRCRWSWWWWLWWWWCLLPFTLPLEKNEKKKLLTSFSLSYASRLGHNNNNSFLTFCPLWISWWTIHPSYDAG